MTATPRDPKLDLYEEHEDNVLKLQEDLLEDVLPRLVDELSLTETQESRLRNFLLDTATIFRFYRKAKFDYETGRGKIENTLRWRMECAIDDSEVTENMPVGMFEHASGMEDNYGRTCNVLHLSRVLRNSKENTLDGVREYIVCVWEASRRRMQQISQQTGELRIQMVLLVDLSGATMSNMEVELLPYMSELLKNHFPGMVGAILIVNYTWLYAGMWTLAKRIMPQIVLERIEFPTTAELLEHFPSDKLAREYGGSLQTSLGQIQVRTDTDLSPTRQPWSASLTPERPPEGHEELSPYSPRNPYYGYTYGDSARRRKRDLLRTLMYLLSLRVLAVRRHLEAWGWTWAVVGVVVLLRARRLKYKIV